MASMTVNDYIDVGTGGMHVATSWQFAKDKDFTQIIDESIKDYKNVKKWHSKLPKRTEDKSSPDAEEYYTELDELWGRCKILVGETESDWFVVGPMSQRKQRVMVTDRTVENEEDPEGPLLTTEYMSNSTALGWTEEVFDQDDPDILGPIIPEPKPEEEENEEGTGEESEGATEGEGTGVEEETEEEQGGNGLGGDPVLPDMEFKPTEEEEDNTVIIPEEEPSVDTEQPSVSEGDVTPSEPEVDVEAGEESAGEQVESTEPVPEEQEVQPAPDTETEPGSTEQDVGDSEDTGEIISPELPDESQEVTQKE